MLKQAEATEYFPWIFYKPRNHEYKKSSMSKHGEGITYHTKHVRY